jgi:hypothetical protein
VHVFPVNIKVVYTFWMKFLCRFDSKRLQKTILLQSDHGDWIDAVQSSV